MSDSTVEKQSDRVNKQVQICLEMKPDDQEPSYDKMRSRLGNLNFNTEDIARKLRSSSEVADMKKFESYFVRFTDSIKSLNKSCETLTECICFAMNKLQNLESGFNSLTLKIGHLEAKLTTSNSNSYASVVKNSDQKNDTPTQDNRINKLEYQSSERERENRLLHVILTHPLIDSDAPDLTNYIQDFMSNTLNMERREIDLNLKASKLRKDHSVLVTLSNARFKNFIYAARKKKRTADPLSCDGLFVSDHLTQFNYSILNTLKAERRKRKDSELASFEYVFTFNGRVYVKKSSNSDKILIRDKVDCMSFIEGLSELN